MPKLTIPVPDVKKYTLDPMLKVVDLPFAMGRGIRHHFAKEMAQTMSEAFAIMMSGDDDDKKGCDNK